MSFIRQERDIRFLKGVGEKRAALFAKLGITTAEGLLRSIPRSYIDKTRVLTIGEAPLNELCVIRAEIASLVSESRVKGGMLLYKFTVTDGEKDLTVTLFNRKYLAAKLRQGDRYLLYGRVTGTLFQKEMVSPDMTIATEQNEKGEILPVYPLTNGLTRQVFTNAVQNAYALLSSQLSGALPKELEERYSLCSYQEAIKSLHFPKSFEEIEKGRKRLVFEEFLIFQLGLLKLKTRNRGSAGQVMTPVDLTPFADALTFTLTNAQKRVIEECVSDMCKDTPMSRLIQGDVGSGKTAVAAALCYFAAKNGGQIAFMVPTEILAAQHFHSLSPLLSSCGLKVALLTGSTKAKEKKETAERCKNGEIDLLIGTHALIESTVGFHRLSLVITDEQHRFGVRQRALLSEKGNNPHILVMSATPIPRTLGLIVYGDLDISIIDELPPGRKKVSTFLCDESYRDRLNGFIEKECREGRQVYIVCPLVEESDKSELKAVDSYFETLKEHFPSVSCGYLHGKLKASDKDKIMSAFSENQIQLLLATTVIEVGVDVPNATLMVIENAERFGLSQLHQLRGRVGRGSAKSYCILMSDTKSKATLERLKIMTETNDGFVISEKDLQIRGPGDFFGQQQHGLPMIKYGSIYSDMELLNATKELAKELYPELLAKKERHSELIAAVNRFFMETGITVFN